MVLSRKVTSGGPSLSGIPCHQSAVTPQRHRHYPALRWRVPAAHCAKGPIFVTVGFACMCSLLFGLLMSAGWTEGAVKTDVSSLIRALRDPNPRARWTAANALRRMGEEAKTAVPALIEALKDSNLSVRFAVADALERMPATAVPALIGALKDSDSQVRRAAAFGLKRMGKTAKAAVPALVEALRDSDPQVRSAAASALEHDWAKAAVPALAKALRDSDRQVRNAAAYALWQMGAEAMGAEAKTAVSALAEALRDSDDHFRFTAGNVLGQMLKVSDVTVRRAAAAALVQGGVAAAGDWSELSEALKDSDEAVRTSAATALEQTVPYFIEKLKDSHELIPAVAAHALGQMGPLAKAAVPALTEALNDSHSEVRQEAAEALGRMGPTAKAAIPILTKLLNNKDEKTNIKETAASALVGIAGYLQDAPDTSFVSDLERARDAIKAIGFSADYVTPINRSIAALRAIKSANTWGSITVFFEKNKGLASVGGVSGLLVLWAFLSLSFARVFAPIPVLRLPIDLEVYTLKQRSRLVMLYLQQLEHDIRKELREVRMVALPLIVSGAAGKADTVPIKTDAWLEDVASQLASPDHCRIPPPPLVLV